MSEQCELCGDQDSLVLQSRCHFTAPLQAEKVDGWLILRCYLPECRKEVARYPITHTAAHAQGRREGLREAGEYAHQCKLERNRQIVNLGGTLPDDQRKEWLECKASEAMRIEQWCARQAEQQIDQAQGGCDEQNLRR